jgi:hypothetical protein
VWRDEACDVRLWLDHGPCMELKWPGSCPARVSKLGSGYVVFDMRTE